MTDHGVQAAFEHLRQSRALHRVLEIGLVRIDVRRQLSLAPQVVEGVFEGRENVFRCQPEPLRDCGEKLTRDLRRDASMTLFVVDQLRVVPDRLAVATPEAVQRPAWQLLTRIPLSLAEVRQPKRRVLLLEPVIDLDGEPPLVRPHRRGVPFGAVRIIDGNECRFAAHGQAHVAGQQLRIDGVAELLDFRPLLLGVGLVTRGASQMRSTFM